MFNFLTNFFFLKNSIYPTLNTYRNLFLIFLPITFFSHTLFPIEYSYFLYFFTTLLILLYIYIYKKFLIIKVCSVAKKEIWTNDTNEVYFYLIPDKVNVYRWFKNKTELIETNNEPIFVSNEIFEDINIKSDVIFIIDHHNSIHLYQLPNQELKFIILNNKKIFVRPNSYPPHENGFYKLNQ